MTRTQFYQAIAEKSELKAKDIKAVYEATLDVIMKSLVKEGKIPLGTIGTLKLRNRPARMGRNPATGESIKIAAKTVVKFLVAKSIKDAFAKKKTK